MNKLELNNKLAKLYKIFGTHKRICGIDSKKGNIYAYDLLVDDWSRLMDLAVDNNLSINQVINYQSGELFSVCATSKTGSTHADFIDHESAQAATRFAIAMALVKLAEDK